MLRYILLVLFSCSWIQSTFAQGFTVGRFYPPEEYNGFQQVWETVQDTNQYLYFGDGLGLLIYDGVSWQKHHIGSDGRSRSFFRDSRELVYLSGQFDFGIAGHDSLNRYQLNSLSPGDRSIYEQTYNEHLKTFQIGDSVIFYGASGLDIWEDDSLRQYPFKNGQTVSFQLKSRIFVSNDEGIHEFKDGAFHLISGSEKFSGDRLNAAIRLREDEVLLGFGNAGLITFDGSEFNTFNEHFNQTFAKGFVYDLKILNDSLLAVALANDGLLITDHSGDVREVYTKSNGFKHQGLLGVYNDHESNLWLNLWGGIEKLLTGVPMRVYTEKEGIGQELYGISKLMDEIVVWGTGKIYRADLKYNGYLTFSEQVINLPGSVSDYHTSDGRIFLISGSDLYELDGDQLKMVKKGGMLAFIEDLSGNDRLMVFGTNGIHTLKNDTWEQFPLEHDLSFVFNSYFYDKRWFINTRRMVYEVKGDSLVDVPFEDRNNQPISVNMMATIDGRLYAGTHGAGENTGLFRFDDESGRFKKDHETWKNDPELTNSQILSLKQCPNGDVWFYNYGAAKRATKNVKDEWMITDTPYQLIGDKDAIYTIECMKDGEVWFGGTKGLFQLKNPEWRYSATFKTNITGIYVDNDSLIYGGFGEPDRDLILPYQDNELRFTYAASSFIDEEQNRYSVKLEGFEDDWSEWTSETQKDYTNIPEGDYVFRVRSKNVFEAPGLEDAISFEVLPPWYRTWWAYILFALSLGGILYTGYRIRVEQLLRVERMRTRIASDLHDEISATLTGISYFAEAVDKDDDDQNKKRFVMLIRESASDAKEKITDIVWSINPEHDDITAFLARCRRYASDLLESKGIQYKMEIPEKYPGKLPMDYRQHFWLIFKEILTNAVRHSGASQLNIRIHIKKGVLSLLIQDNGHGFNETDQVQGNGLSNIRRRAEQMNASVDFDSDPDFGTRWHISINI